MKQPKILFFIAGFAPTEEERELAASLGEEVQVSYRNAQFIDPEHRPEQCDGVASVIPMPEPYAKHPTAEDALAGWKEAVAKRRSLVGDKPAPEARPAGENGQGGAKADADKPKATTPAAAAWKPNA